MKNRRARKGAKKTAGTISHRDGGIKSHLRVGAVLIQVIC
ncbi:hypothetical protein KPSA3_00813 [Pseudomonas syringae pv. actinidiae]|uniref:Uncharacterized protein n=1 Tax=Pseudomonas syringae pv. actinidiae TaxID=103796 RepID=A0AAN4Q0R3_PSESF|nr:hypothetical protein KPSA3_00813 [Pseudomonas syringae pv. actinidiae]